jgi:nucleotide-binding universal stress UspA family protein
MPIEPMGPVVVGVDGSAGSLAAVELAAEEAVGRVAPLLVVHAHQEHSEWRGEELAGQRAAARRLLAVAAARARAEHPCLSVEEDLVLGSPVEVLVERSRGASLLVMGHRGHRLPTGSLAVAVMEQAEVPVIVHRSLDTSVPVPQPRPVLVAVARVAGSDSVVEFAFAEAALRGAPLTAMHVWPAQPVAGHPLDEGRAAAERQQADQVLTEALAGWADKYPDVRVTRVVRHSLDVPVAVSAASHLAQLVVVGSTRHTAAVRPVPGSVSHVLVYRAGCSVAVVPR